MGLGSLLKKGIGKLGKAALSSAGAGVGLDLLSGLFGGRSEKKKAEAARKAQIEQMNLAQTMAEDKRLGNVNAGASLLAGIPGLAQISPEALAALKQRRTYDFSKAVPEAGAGMGSGLLAGLLGRGADYAFQYGANQQDAGGGSSDIFRVGAPIKTTLDTGFGPSGNLGTGVDAGVGPQGVSLDDLKNLYKLGGSGTQDFG